MLCNLSNLHPGVWQSGDLNTMNSCVFYHDALPRKLIICFSNNPDVFHLFFALHHFILEWWYFIF